MEEGEISHHMNERARDHQPAGRVDRVKPIEEVGSLPPPHRASLDCPREEEGEGKAAAPHHHGGERGDKGAEGGRLDEQAVLLEVFEQQPQVGREEDE